MSWLFSQALVEEYTRASSSDGKRFAPLKLTNTAEMYLWRGKTTELSRLSQFGTTCEPCRERTGAALMSLAADFLVRTSVSRDRDTGSKDLEADFGWKWPESFAKLDRDTSSWKTRQRSLLGGSETYSETWPKWGLMRHGECSALDIWEPRMYAIGFGSSEKTEMLPTITATDYGSRNNGQRGDGTKYKLAGSLSLQAMARKAGGKLNPAWVAWFMGWPIGATGLEPLGTDKFQAWRRSHGKRFLEG